MEAATVQSYELKLEAHLGVGNPEPGALAPGQQEDADVPVGGGPEGGLLVHLELVPRAAGHALAQLGLHRFHPGLWDSGEENFS